MSYLYSTTKFQHIFLWFFSALAEFFYITNSYRTWCRNRPSQCSHRQQHVPFCRSTLRNAIGDNHINRNNHNSSAIYCRKCGIKYTRQRQHQQQQQRLDQIIANYPHLRLHCLLWNYYYVGEQRCSLNTIRS